MKKRGGRSKRPSFSSKDKVKLSRTVLNKDVWVTSSNFGKIRAKLLDEQGGVCAILQEPMDKPCLDHDHYDGKCRGVIGSSINLFEGTVQKLWDKHLSGKTQVTLSETLRRLADYLEKDNSNMPFHEGIVVDLKKALARRTKDTISRNAFENLGIVIGTDLEKSEMIRLYVEEFIVQIERNYLNEK